MAKEKVILELEVKDGDLSKLKKSTDKTADSFEKLNKQTEKSGDNIGSLDKMSGGMIGRFGGMIKGLRGMATGFKSVGVAIAASGIGLIVLAISAIGAAFKSSEEGQNQFAKLMQYIGTIVGNLMDLLSDLGEILIEAITNPREAWEKFVDAMDKGYQFIKQQVVDRFTANWTILTKGFEAGVLKMRIAWNKFTGDAEEAEQLEGKLKDVQLEIKKSIDLINERNKDVIDLYDKAKGKLTEFIAEQARELQMAGWIADQRAKADKIERGLIVERAKANRDIAAAQEKAEMRDKYTAEQRIKFLEEAADIERAITEKEIAAAKLRRDAIIEENTHSKSNKEALAEEEEAKARIIELETARLGITKRLTTKIQSLRNEAKAALDAMRADDTKSVGNVKTEGPGMDPEVQHKIEVNDMLMENDKYYSMWRKKQAEEDTENIKGYEEQLMQQKLGIASSTFKNLSSILGEQSALGKGAAIAAGMIDTYESANAAYSSMAGIPVVGPALGAVAAAAAVASGLKSVGMIKKQKTPGGRPAPVSAAGGGGGAFNPNFNIVGDTGSNRIGEAIGDELNKKPVKAYVAMGDIKEGQDVERNAVRTSSL